jgi:hypothetical protein
MSERWPQEVIPDTDVLYMRVHKNNVKDGEVQPGAFVDHEGAMSTNWQKYCHSPVEARSKARKPIDNGVLSAVTGDLRAVPLVVEHTPDEQRNDRSHTDVRGEKSPEVRLKLYDAFSWRLRIEG